jgi:hypothetical protein
MEINLFCPLGKSCEEIKDDKLYWCSWYVKLLGKDPQGEKQFDEWGCAIGWLPILLVENAQTNRGQTEALESFRNEMAKGQKEFNLLLADAARRKAIGRK